MVFGLIIGRLIVPIDKEKTLKGREAVGAYQAAQERSLSQDELKLTNTLRDTKFTLDDWKRSGKTDKPLELRHDNRIFET